MKCRCSARFAVINCDINDQQLPDPADAVHYIQAGPQGARYRRPRGEKINISTARTIMAGCMSLLDATVFPRPTDLPVVHLAQAPRSILAQERRETLIAE